MTYPKVVALDTDWTIFWGWLDIDKIGKGPNAYSPAEDNLEFEPGYKDWVLRDRTNHKERIGMYSDVPNIIHDILKNGAKLAIVSRNKSRALCNRALWYFKAKDPKDKRMKPIIDLAKFNEVYDEDLSTHFRRIHGWTNDKYTDMILFDDEPTNNLIRVELGVTYQLSRDQKGLTWANYQEGINTWRRTQAIRSPYIGQNLDSYPEKMFLGFSGIDEQTVQLLTQGKHRIDMKESARWGYAMYITDDINMAKFFANWIKRDAFGSNAKTYVCEIWARDRQKFLAMNKIWFPEEDNIMIAVKTETPSNIAWSQENRDLQAAQWGAQRPYILFARHGWTDEMPIPPSRWTEMVVYAQAQEALTLTIPLSDQEVADKISLGGRFVKFDEQIANWNITVPNETWADFRKHNESIHY